MAQADDSAKRDDDLADMAGADPLSLLAADAVMPGASVLLELAELAEEAQRRHERTAAQHAEVAQLGTRRGLGRY